MGGTDIGRMHPKRVNLEVEAQLRALSVSRRAWSPLRSPTVPVLLAYRYMLCHKLDLITNQNTLLLLRVPQVKVSKKKREVDFISTSSNHLHGR